MKVIFVGEPAEDEGGPKRKFLRLALSAAIGDPTLFSGPARNRVILHSTAACIQQHFLYVGKLISMSLCQGGPGPACLASWCYNYLCFGITLSNLESAQLFERVTINVKVHTTTNPISVTGGKDVMVADSSGVGKVTLWQDDIGRFHE